MATPNTPAQQGTEKLSVHATGADRLGYQIACGDLPSVKKTKLKDWPTFDELRQDLWTSLYRPEPELTPAEKLDQSHRPNGQVMQAVLNSPAFGELHSGTAFDEVKAGEATILMAEKLPEILAAMPKDPSTGQPDASGPGGQEALQGAIDQALRETTEEQQANEDLLDALGAGKDAAGHEFNAQERIDLARSLMGNQNFQKLAKLVGRLNVAAASVKSAQHGGRTSEVGGFELGSSLPHALPSELALAADEDLELLFLKRFADSALMQRELHSDTHLERGPMIVCLDRSGSMADSSSEPNVSLFDWGKAVMLALLNVCRRDRRPLSLITFTGGASVDLYAPKGRLTKQQIQHLGRMTPSGGTSFSAALTACFDEIATKPGLRQADVVFITDGGDLLDHVGHLPKDQQIRPVLQRFLDRKEALNCRVWGVQVGGGVPDPQYSDLPRFCDRVATLKGDGADALNLILGKATA